MLCLADRGLYSFERFQNARKTAGLFKDERVIASQQSAVIETAGRRVVNLCANNYLGLANHPEAEVSITSTLFLGLRLRKNTQLYCDPEMAGGRGFSGTNGIANFPNGEMPRVATATPKPYLARLYVTQDFGFGDRMEQVESDANRSAHAVHGLGHNVQRRMGLPGRHSRLHLGLDA